MSVPICCDCMQTLMICEINPVHFNNAKYKENLLTKTMLVLGKVMFSNKGNILPLTYPLFKSTDLLIRH